MDKCICRQFFKQNASICKLIMPNEFQWNLFTKALESYLKTWPFYKIICENSKHRTYRNTENLIANIALRRNPEDCLKQTEIK